MGVTRRGVLIATALTPPAAWIGGFGAVRTAGASEASSARARAARPWSEIIETARGQTVYFNAWGGSPKTNAYIEWVGGRVAAMYGVTVRLVKLSDTADAVGRIRAEKAVGRTEGGSIDLLWINGENFATLRRNDLLFGPFAQRLPNFALVDTIDKPTLLDFTVPVEGFESPWSMARFVFVHDVAVTPNPPRTARALLEWAKRHPGRFTYPQPPQFLGSTFLKQALLSLRPGDPALYRPVEEVAFAERTAPLWNWLDELHPVMWRGGLVFPTNGSDQRRLLNDGEIDISMAFSALEAASAIESALLPPTARVFTLDGGAIGNVNFVAIPFNATAPEGAMVVANFLLGAEAQARKLDSRYWGAQTVLDMAKLTPADKAFFEEVPRHPAEPTLEELGPVLPEPHPSWMTRIEAEWRARYAAG